MKKRYEMKLIVTIHMDSPYYEDKKDAHATIERETKRFVSNAFSNWQKKNLVQHQNTKWPKVIVATVEELKGEEANA